MSRIIKPTEFEMDRHPESGIGVLSTERGILPLRSLDVRAQIFGLGSKTIVRQTFFNSFDEPIEATYIFPLPGRDAVTRFVMHVNDQTIEGELQERGQARELYDQAMRDGHAAAIAEEDRSETFTIRVGNIPPGEEVAIEMTLVGQLPIAGDQATFRFPLVIAPRYISGNPLKGKSVGDGVANDTDRVPDASRVTPPVLFPGMPNPVELSIEVDIHAPESFDRNELVSQLSSSLHSVVVSDLGVEDGLPLRIRVQPGERLNRDFILRFPFLANPNSCSLLAAADGAGASVFSVNIVPPEGLSEPQAPRDVVFLLDRSGSMGGWKMVAARRAVGRMIDSMRDEDRFSVLAFDNSIEFPSNAKKTFVTGADRNRWETLQWVTTLEARGGTELENAIAAGIRLHQKKGRRECQPLIVLITDGQVGAEDAVLKTIKNYSGTQTPTFFCLGIDKAVNHGLLTRIAKMTSGTCETVESEVQLDNVMDRFHQEIGAPVLTDLTLEWQGKSLKVDQLTPNGKINIFPQRPISIFGIAHTSEDFELTVSAKTPDGQHWTTTVTAQDADAETLHALWGRERLRDLEDQYVVSSKKKKLQKQIVDVSLKSHVLSRFTSYVAVDRTRVVNEAGLPQKVVQPVEQVEDSEIGANSRFFGSIFGRLDKKRAKPNRSIKMAKAKRVGGQRGRYRNQVDDFALEDCDADFSLSSLSPLEDLGDNSIAGESCDGPMQEFTDTSIDFTATGDSDEESSIDRMIKMMDEEAFHSNASAIIIQKVDGVPTVEHRVNGSSIIQDRLSDKLLAEICDRINAFAGIDPSADRQPRIGDWYSSYGKRWRAMTFSDASGSPIMLLADLDRNAPLSVTSIKDPVEVREMLRHYPWLRTILDSICNLANSNRDSRERSKLCENVEKWFALLEEISNQMTDPQANVIMRMIESFRSAFERCDQSQSLDTIDVLNDMIDDSNQAIREEERKAFWS